VQSCWTAVPTAALDDDCDEADPQAATAVAKNTAAVTAEALISTCRVGEAWWCRIRLTP
jgi:hypothetical protein